MFGLIYRGQLLHIVNFENAHSESVYFNEF
jgi:hypothetical protein